MIQQMANSTDMLTMLVCATRWLYMHLCTLAYMYMHESYLLVCRPYFNTMKLWTSDPNLHLSFCPRGHHLLSAFLLVCLLSPLLVCLYPCFYACHIYLACSLYVLLLLSMQFPSIACLLVFLSLPLHVHTWSEDT